MSKKFTCENCLYYMQKTIQSKTKIGMCQKTKKDALYYQNKCIDYHFVEPSEIVFKKSEPKQLELIL